jgi:hypothetical protein
MYQLLTAVAIHSLTIAGLASPQLATRARPAVTAATAELVKWDLRLLNKEPFKLIKATPDPKRGLVRFVVEFTRPVSVTEQYDWEQGRGPAVFRFLDEDGVVLRTVRPRLEGEVVPEKGMRIRLVMAMPDVRIQELTRSIVAD